MGVRCGECLFETLRLRAYVSGPAYRVSAPGRMWLTVEIVLLAMIALFVGLRLYAVLGQRTGHEQSPLVTRPDAAPDAAPALPGRRGGRPPRGRPARRGPRRSRAASPTSRARRPEFARSSPPIQAST